MNDKTKSLDFWNKRAAMGALAGTNDFMLTTIEQEYIKNFIPINSRVMDIGCGNAMTLIALAKEKNCSGVGIDFSDQMIEESKARIKESRLNNLLEVFVHKIPPIPLEYGKFDFVITNRSLINLLDVREQKKAVQEISNLLKPGGIYMMVECFNDGAIATNNLRQQLGLEKIEAPWHNLFFNKSEVEGWQSEDFKIIEQEYISSTYHFLSRVVYAKLANDSGEELRYDSEINKIALMLPKNIGNFGPVKALIWKKD